MQLSCYNIYLSQVDTSSIAVPILPDHDQQLWWSYAAIDGLIMLFEAQTGSGAINLM